MLVGLRSLCLPLPSFLCTCMRLFLVLPCMLYLSSMLQPFCHSHCAKKGSREMHGCVALSANFGPGKQRPNTSRCPSLSVLSRSHAVMSSPVCWAVGVVACPPQHMSSKINKLHLSLIPHTLVMVIED